MAIVKRGTFSKSYASTMKDSADITVKCFACKKSVTFDPITETTPSQCSHCGCKDMRDCMGDSCVCESCEDLKSE